MWRWGGGGGNNHCLVPEDKSSLNQTKIAHLFCLKYIYIVKDIYIYL